LAHSDTDANSVELSSQFSDRAAQQVLLKTRWQFSSVQFSSVQFSPLEIGILVSQPRLTRAIRCTEQR